MKKSNYRFPEEPPPPRPGFGTDSEEEVIHIAEEEEGE